MFEQKLEKMTATIHVNPEMFNTLTAANVGGNCDSLNKGWFEYDYSAALKIIAWIDRSLLSCPKYLKKRVTSQRNSFVFAFGPEMVDVCGVK